MSSQPLPSVFRPPRLTLAQLAALAVPAVAMGVLIYKFDVLPTLALVLAPALLALLFVKAEAATLVVLFVLYTNVSVIAIRFYSVPQPVAASFFLLLGIPLLKYVVWDRQRILTNSVLFLMGLYLVALLTSAFFSRSPEQSFQHILIYLSEGVILYFLVLNTVRTRSLLRAALWTLILAGTLLGCISLFQEFTSAHDDAIGGFGQTKGSEITTGTDQATGEEIVRRRQGGPLNDKNRYAQVMIVLLPLALSLFWSERSRRLRLVAAAACIPILSGALMTFSRGAGVALGFLLLSMLLLRIVRVRQSLAYALAAVTIVMLIVPDYAYRISTLSRAGSMASGDPAMADASIRGRATENLATFYIFLDNPLLGVGPGQAMYDVSQYGNESGFRRLYGPRRGHNMYLEELANTGLIGFAVLLAIIAATLGQLARARNHWVVISSQGGYLATGIFLAILTYLGSAMFLHLAYQRYFWLLLALAGAAVQIARAEAAARATRARSAPAA